MATVIELPEVNAEPVGDVIQLIHNVLPFTFETENNDDINNNNLNNFFTKKNNWICFICFNNYYY